MARSLLLAGTVAAAGSAPPGPAVAGLAAVSPGSGPAELTGISRGAAGGSASGVDAGGVAIALLQAAIPPVAAARAPGPFSPATLTPSIVSGLRWRSGASADAAFAAWRGRALDVRVVFVQHDSFREMEAKLAGRDFRTNVAQTPQAVVSLAMLPRDRPRQHAACAAGAFDSQYRLFGSLLARAGAGRAIVRLGWEANAGSDSHPWGIDNMAEVPAYVACFRREVAALKTTAPGIRIEWTNAKRGSFPVSELLAYPGDDVVDVWGVHYYDTGPRKTTQVLWDHYNMATQFGGPWGLGAWLREAQARGKKLAVPEWGVWDNGEPAPADNPLYIENMYRFFSLNAESIEYENYYNRNSAHQLHPATRFDAARALYQQLWSGGRR